MFQNALALNESLCSFAAGNTPSADGCHEGPDERKKLSIDFSLICQSADEKKVMKLMSDKIGLHSLEFVSPFPLYPGDRMTFRLTATSYSKEIFGKGVVQKIACEERLGKRQWRGIMKIALNEQRDEQALKSLIDHYARDLVNELRVRGIA